jgi:hypothetical protein
VPPPQSAIANRCSIEPPARLSSVGRRCRAAQIQGRAAALPCSVEPPARQGGWKRWQSPPSANATRKAEAR